MPLSGQIADGTAEDFRVEIAYLSRLKRLVTDALVRAEIQKRIEEFEGRLSELEPPV